MFMPKSTEPCLEQTNFQVFKAFADVPINGIAGLRPHHLPRILKSKRKKYKNEQEFFSLDG